MYAFCSTSSFGGLYDERDVDEDAFDVVAVADDVDDDADETAAAVVDFGVKADVARRAGDAPTPTLGDVESDDVDADIGGDAGTF